MANVRANGTLVIKASFAEANVHADAGREVAIGWLATRITTGATFTRVRLSSRGTALNDIRFDGSARVHDDYADGEAAEARQILARHSRVRAGDVDGHLLGRFMHVDRMRSGGYLLERRIHIRH